MRRRIPAIAIALLLIGAGCSRTQPAPPPTETASPTTSSAERPASTPTQPISITSPLAGAVVGNPIIASGKGIAFENTIQLRVRDSLGRITGEGFATAYAPEYDAPGPWRAAIACRQVKDDRCGEAMEGYLEAYESSAKDGSELHLVRVPIRFATDMIPIQVALLDAAEGDPGNGSVCPLAIEWATYAIPPTKGVARAAVEVLLTPPPPIPETNPTLMSALALTHADLRGITIVNGVATVDLSLSVLEKTSGFDNACRARQAAAQLRATLTRFATIREVRILIDGKPHPLFP